MPRQMFDSTSGFDIPTSAQMVAGYIDGQSFKWTDAMWDRFPNAVKVRIARRTTTNDGHVLDVEEGIPTVWPINVGIVDWVQMRRRAGIEPTIYCNQLNDWQPLRQLFASYRISEPLWWVARYNGVPDIPAGAIAKQYANPPLAGGHYDLSAVADYWPGVDGVQEENMADSDQVTVAAWRIAAIAYEWTEWPAGTPDVVKATPVPTFGDDFKTIGALVKQLTSTVEARMLSFDGRLQSIQDKLDALVGEGLTVTSEGSITIKAIK